MPAKWLADAVSTFGRECQAKLAGGGEEEAAIRSPIEVLLGSAGRSFRLTVVPYDEYRDTERAVRPDYAISVGGVITGYIEVKRPGLPLDPGSFTGHNLTQWNKLRDLPNLLYTNGTEWRLWRDGELKVGPVYFTGGSLRSAGTQLAAPDEFESLLRTFLDWEPQPITAVGPLVNAVAPLTRLLRSEVLDQLAAERALIASGAMSLASPSPAWHATGG